MSRLQSSTVSDQLKAAGTYFKMQQCATTNVLFLSLTFYLSSNQKEGKNQIPQVFFNWYII